MKILIIEDDFSFAVDVELGLKALGYTDITIVNNVDQVLELVQKQDFNLLIIDVNLNNDLSGIDLASQLRETNIPVIFITALKDEATFKEAMLVDPSAFLVKPFDKVTLQSCIDRAVKHKGTGYKKNAPKSQILDGCFFIKQNDLLKKIEFEEILWIEADGNYIDVHLSGKRVATKISLTKVQEKINVPYFVRVHKKFLINIKKVDMIISSSELLINKKIIPIGSRYRSHLMRVINSVDY